MNIFESETTAAGAVALGVVLALRDIWVDVWGLGPEDELFASKIEPMANDPTTSGKEMSAVLDELAISSTDEVADELKKNLSPDQWKNLSNATTKCTQWALFETAMAFAVQAIRAQAEKSPEELTWTHACEAKYFLGTLQGSISRIAESNPGIVLAKRGADARHAENRAMKAQLFDWCSKNLSTFKSMDAAAFAVVQTEIPVQFRTARSWIGEWKRLQPAGTL